MRFRDHGEYLRSVAEERAQRAKSIAETIRTRLGAHVSKVAAEVVQLESVSQVELASLLAQDPSLLKPLIAACNMGKRALRKDLAIELDTFKPKLDEQQTVQIAEYLHPLLPKSILIETLIALDAYQWVDSAIRKIKGRWERQFVTQLRERRVSCKKRKFDFEGQEFELDIAYPDTGDILVGVDVKMIGHPSDKHKRSDEIVNKAKKFKAVYPSGVFISLLYYPFAEDRRELEDRLRHGTEEIREVIFAGDDDESVAEAVRKIAELCSPGSRGKT